ncbi:MULTISPECIES: hypothetical protein [Flavobacteriaceae]|uniref:hypothetical protein n=1 Tax=Flavobacteriaceae TaxID=49546 RepID=UPI000B7C4982|nr:MULTISPECIES: hypothetical protein [Flavobacteriaceae]EKT4498923.1 hypothetical protein [Flavobacterium psychrophilum]EKT4509608.1 hypothetical protein [Flavobacterium psychrophilum]ELM3651133.1 hypothetical protein [Flavobacterium psychrophilum]ELM3672306.1 hypothetical protein [Flavobacterium psychrophilum]ELM3726643.1 hypothetical protein [Flavobacterium psychrophilum]
MANTTGKKYGGRSKGTPNRSTAETKELLKTILGKELDKLGVMLEQLEPMERVNALSKLLPYILPKQQEMSIEVKENLTAEAREQRILELKKKL